MDPIRTIAVIGAGTAGRAFALRCARAGFAVVLEDVMPEKLRRAQDEYGEQMGKLSPGGSLSFSMTVEEAVHGADIAIDFVPDELESKLEIFSMLDRMAPPRTVLCTPTEALSITDLASCTYRAERCVGVSTLLGERVDLIRSHYLAADVADAVKHFMETLGFSATFVDDAVAPMLMKNLGSNA